MATEILSKFYAEIKKAHTAATTAKAFLLLNGKVVMPMNTAAANEENVFVYRAEKLRAPKVAAQAWVGLGPIYWDDTAKNFTTTATANTLAGRIALDAAAADTEGVIDLDPAA